MKINEWLGGGRGDSVKNGDLRIEMNFSITGGKEKGDVVVWVRVRAGRI